MYEVPSRTDKIRSSSTQRLLTSYTEDHEWIPNLTNRTRQADAPQIRRFTLLRKQKWYLKPLIRYQALLIACRFSLCAASSVSSHKYSLRAKLLASSLKTPWTPMVQLIPPQHAHNSRLLTITRWLEAVRTLRLSGWTLVSQCLQETTWETSGLLSPLALALLSAPVDFVLEDSIVLSWREDNSALPSVYYIECSGSPRHKW